MRNIIALLLVTLTVSGVEAKKPHRDPEAFKTMDEFGGCVAEQRSAAIKFLSTLPDSKEEDKQARRISTPACLQAAMLKFKAHLLRGAVAEMLLKRYPSGFPRAGAKYTFDLPTQPEIANESDEQKGLIALVLFGQCVANDSPASVKSLLSTPVESKAESLAFASLRNSMAKCTTVDFRADRFQMRGYLAEGAYRNAVALAPG